MAKVKTFLFVSNCFGEDIAASLIARELLNIATTKCANLEIYGASLISGGEEYKKKGIKVVYSSKLPPSGGFPTKSISGFFADFFSGSLFSIYSFLKRLKDLRGKVDLLFVVGDVFLLYLVRRVFKIEKIIFFALAKSDYFMPHYKIEKNYIKKNVDLMFTRDELTAENLRKDEINAIFLGNPLMDNLSSTGLNLEISSNINIIGILPGSRAESYKNLILILDVLKKISYENLMFLVALPESMDESILQSFVEKAGFSYSVKKPFPEILVDGKRAILMKGYFADVISMSKLIIGLAGTANEQAAGKGKPVVSFKGSGPQTTHQRMREQEKLMGGSVKYIKDYPLGVVKEILFLLENEKERNRRGKIGMERMGEEGGSRRIAEFVFNKFCL